MSGAERLSPLDPSRWAFTVTHSMTCTLLGRYDEAVDLARETIREPHAVGFWPPTALASALGNLGRIDEARAALDNALRAKPGMTLAFLEDLMPTNLPGGLAPYLNGLRKAGLT